MKTTRFLAATVSYLTMLASSGMALSQAEIEVRKAQPAPDAPMIEIVPPKAGPAPKAAASASMTAPAVAATPAAAPSREVPISEKNGNTYKLRTNDQLDIRVFGQPDLSGLATVREDGMVRLNLIQEQVAVGGLTLGAVETRIRMLLAKDYLRDPRVSVQIVKYAVMRVTVMGRVNQPRTIPVPSNSPVDLVQAIGMAGGKTSLGNLKKVYLKRGDAVQVFNVEEMMRSVGGQKVELRDGDIIDVPEKLW